MNHESLVGVRGETDLGGRGVSEPLEMSLSGRQLGPGVGLGTCVHYLRYQELNVGPLYSPNWGLSLT